MDAIGTLLEQFLEFCSNTNPYLLCNLYTSSQDRVGLIGGFLASLNETEKAEAAQGISPTVRIWARDYARAWITDQAAFLKTCSPRAQQAVLELGANAALSKYTAVIQPTMADAFAAEFRLILEEAVT